MASLYKQKESNIWWVKYRNPKTGKIERKSTGFRSDNGPDTRRAQEVEAQKTLAERQAPAIAIGKWDTWVESFIRQQVTGTTQVRYLSAWRTLRMWLAEHQIASPRHVTYQICLTYTPWRAQPNKRKGKYNAGTNTAIFEFKLFRWIMSEAVRRDFCAGNPAREMKLKRQPRKLYPDYTDEQLQQIYEIINKEPEITRPQYLRCFAIALLHGVRLNETNPNPMKDIQLGVEIPTIRFFQKGGKVRIKPLHPQLIPLFTELQQQGATLTYQIKSKEDKIVVDKNGKMTWGSRWTVFFTRHGFKAMDPNACFHSLRVTVENVLRKAGVEQRVREYYLSHEHGNRDVNAAYDRIKISEMKQCHEPLARPWLKI